MKLKLLEVEPLYIQMIGGLQGYLHDITYFCF